MTLLCHTSMIDSVLSDKNLLYTASKDHTIKIWDKNDNFRLVKILHAPSPIYYVTVDNCHIYASLSDFGSGLIQEQIMVWTLLNDFKFI